MTAYHFILAYFGMGFIYLAWLHMNIWKQLSISDKPIVIQFIGLLVSSFLYSPIWALIAILEFLHWITDTESAKTED